MTTDPAVAPAAPAAPVAAAVTPGSDVFEGVQPLEYVEMRDAADPRNLAGWHGPVAGYPNRIPPWTPADFRAHAAAGVMRVSVFPEPHWAHICREIDVERFAAQPWHAPQFILMREHLGFTDGGVYFSLSRWPAVRAQLETHQITPDRVRLRVAAWGKRPQQFNLGGGYLAWAHQFDSLAAGFDRNAVFGHPEFSHR